MRAWRRSPGESEGDRQAHIEECRRRFRESGLPLFDEDFSASTNVFNRAAPLLALVFLGEMLGAIQLDWSLAANSPRSRAGLRSCSAAAMAHQPLPRPARRLAARGTSAGSSWPRSSSSQRSCR